MTAVQGVPMGSETAGLETQNPVPGWQNSGSQSSSDAHTGTQSPVSPEISMHARSSRPWQTPGKPGMQLRRQCLAGPIRRVQHLASRSSQAAPGSASHSLVQYPCAGPPLLVVASFEARQMRPPRQSASPVHSVPTEPPVSSVLPPHAARPHTANGTTTTAHLRMRRPIRDMRLTPLTLPPSPIRRGRRAALAAWRPTDLGCTA